MKGSFFFLKLSRENKKFSGTQRMDGQMDRYSYFSLTLPETNSLYLKLTEAERLVSFWGFRPPGRCELDIYYYYNKNQNTCLVAAFYTCYICCFHSNLPIEAVKGGFTNRCPKDCSVRVWDIVAVWRLRKFSLKNLENRYKAQKGNIVKHHLLFLFGVPWLALECIQFIVYFAILQFLQYIYIYICRLPFDL